MRISQRVFSRYLEPDFGVCFAYILLQVYTNYKDIRVRVMQSLNFKMIGNTRARSLLSIKTEGTNFTCPSSQKRCVSETPALEDLLPDPSYAGS